MRWAVGAVLVASLATGCDDGDDDGITRSAQVYVTTIRQAVAQRPAEPDVVPVVYVLAVGERPIGADIQAQVAATLREETEVRFADERAEAIDEDLDGEPVRDRGVLVVVDELEEIDGGWSMEVEFYRSADDRSMVLVSLDADGTSGWSSIPAG